MHPGVRRLFRLGWMAAILPLLAALSPPNAQQPAPTARTSVPSPKLAVIIVIDQMRADYVTRFKNDWTAGFKRLLNEGAWFSRAEYPYLFTVTCAGHATIATGTFPHTHGIIANGWFDRESNRNVLCSDDPAAQDIGYVSQAGDGQSAHRMVVPNFADVMRSQRGSEVVAVSQKERSAIMLAGHGPGIVTWLSPRYDNVMTSSVFAQAPVPAVKAFVASHPLTADYGKSWDRLLPAARYAELDDGPAELPPTGWTRTFPHLFSDPTGQPNAVFREQWNRSPFVDAYMAALTGSLLDSTSIGRRATTDVLAISFSGTDEVGHKFGPKSQEVHDTLLRVDRLLGQLFSELDTLVGRDQYVVAVSADHGVTAPTDEVLQRADRGFLNVAGIRDKVEQLLQRKWGRGPFVASLQGDGGQLYFTPGTYRRLQEDPAVLNQVIAVIQSTPGVQRVLRSEEARSGLASADRILRQAALSYFPDRSGDLLLILQPGWISLTGMTANHGLSGSPEDQPVPIFLMGPRIKPGEYREAATPADIAPTLAALCGISLPHVEGRVLSSALAKSAR